MDELNSTDNKIRVVFKEVGKSPVVLNIVNDYKTLRDLIGGHIEYCFDHLICENVAIVVNEEGKIFGLEENIVVQKYQEDLVGNIVFIKTDPDTADSVSLDDGEIEKIMLWIKKQEKAKVVNELINRKEEDSTNEENK